MPGKATFIATIPDGAQVFLDGKRLGSSPLQVTVPSHNAQHELVIQKEGYKRIARRFVPCDEAGRLEFRLVPER